MTSRSVKDKPIKLIDLKDLRLDANNPRFAEHTSDAGTQRDIVNIIVRQFGVDDVLSSIAVSGYFSAEPLVCKPGKEGEYVVVEGNRRLVAMLLLSDHSDARDHRIRIQKFREIHRQHGEPAFSPAPAVIFEDDDSQKALLSYLGVRHIVSTKPWDSFAKAAWVATALRESHLNLDDIAEMIGDSRQTVKKLLSGYHFIKQLEESGEFSPDNSTRKGRGSNTKYPFSWIYTILGNPVAKKFVSLSEEPTNHKPVPEEYLRNAGLMVRAMFGDNSEGLNPAIDDSRQLTDLAKILANPTKVAYLRQGKSVEEILRLTQPIEELLGSALVEILNGLRAVTARLDEDDLATETASELHGSTQSIKKQATNWKNKFQMLCKGRFMPVDFKKRNVQQKISKGADQTEWNALTHGESPVDGGLSDDIIADAMDDFQQPGYQDTWYEQDVVKDSAAGALYSELEKRGDLIGEQYPFDIENNVLSKTRSNLTYEFCLAISIQGNLTTNPFTLLPRTFERVCAELTRLHLGSYAKTLHTGWPRDQSSPTSFKALVDDIHQQTKEWFWGPDDGLVDDDSNYIKDGGIDFITWNQSPDKQPGQLFITGQCACGEDWYTKYDQTKLENYGTWFNPVSWVKPVPAFCTPYRLVEGHMYEASKRGGIVYERLRLAKLGKMYEQELTTEVRKNMQQCINLVGQN